MLEHRQWCGQPTGTCVRGLSRGLNYRHQRPPTRISNTVEAAAPARAITRSPVGRCNQRAQAGETVGCDEAIGRQFRQRILNLRAQQSALLHQIQKEQRAAVLQQLQDLLRGGAGQHSRRIRRRVQSQPYRRGGTANQDHRRVAQHRRARQGSIIGRGSSW